MVQKVAQTTEANGIYYHAYDVKSHKHVKLVLNYILADDCFNCRRVIASDNGVCLQVLSDGNVIPYRIKLWTIAHLVERTA